MKSNPTIELLMSHRSVRSFEEKPVSEDTISVILNAAQMAPTSSYLQAYTIIRVSDRSKRIILKEASEGQPWIESAPLVLLFCADLCRLDNMLPVKDSNIPHNAELFTVAVTDTALCAQRALIAAQSLGLGGVFVGGIRNDLPSVAKTFSLPNLVFPLFALCMGYPSAIPAQRPRMPLSFIYADDCYPELPNPDMLEEYDNTVLDYFREITEGKSHHGWISRACHALESKPRYGVSSFLKSSGFLLSDSPANTDV